MSDLEPSALRSFSDWLRAHNGGSLDDNLSAQLAELAELVRLADKPGTLTLSLKVKPEGRAVLVSAAVKVAEPAQPSAAFYYVESGYGLTSRNPDQPAIPPDGGDDPERFVDTRRGEG